MSRGLGDVYKRQLLYTSGGEIPIKCMEDNYIKQGVLSCRIQKCLALSDTDEFYESAWAKSLLVSEHIKDDILNASKSH